MLVAAIVWAIPTSVRFQRPVPPLVHIPPSPPSHEVFRFEIEHVSKKPGSNARTGRITTRNGVIETPGFVPVATSGALKGVTNEQSDAAGVQLMFANTYHLLVHPGSDVIEGSGGLHRYMGRMRPLITDSGGFQVFSLAAAAESDGRELKKRNARQGTSGLLLSTKEKGVVFRSYFDSSSIELTPESSVRVQKALGADIIIPLDELPGQYVSRERLVDSVALSHRWMARSLKTHLSDPRGQAMYGVLHGGCDRELRAQSAAFLSHLPFDGYAVGGSLGRDHDDMVELLEYVVPLLADRKRPRHLLGIGDERGVRAAAALGFDTMDSCYPTRIARHGTLLTREGKLHITSAKHARDYGPIDPSLPTIDASRAYMHHLAKMREPLFITLSAIHNLRYMTALMQELREQIRKDEL